MFGLPLFINGKDIAPKAVYSFILSLFHYFIPSFLHSFIKNPNCQLSIIN